MRFLFALVLILFHQAAIAGICTSQNDEGKWLLPEERVNKAYQGKTANLLVTCDNRGTAKPRDIYLRFHYPVLDSVKIYEIGQDESLTFLEDIGDWVTAISRTTNVRKPTFKFSIGANEVKRFKVVISSEGSLQLNHEFLSSNEFIETVEREAFVLAIYYGIVFALIGYNLFLFIQTRQLVFGLYVFYMLSYAIFMANMDGVSHLYLWKDNLWWSNFSTNIIIPIFLSFMLWFSGQFLRLGEYSEKIYKTCLYLGIFMAAYAAIAFILPYRTTSVIGALLSVITIFVLLILGLWASIKHVVARYYTIAWSCLFLGMLTIAMRNLGVISGNILADYAMHIGSGSEAILLSLGLGYRFRALDLLEAENRSNSLIARTTKMIAHDVRRPFSKILSYLEIAEEHIKDTNLANMFNSLKSEVKSDVASVELLLEEIMEIGSSTDRETIDESLAYLVNTSLKQAVRYVGKGGILLKIDVDRDIFLKVDPIKIMRVMSNIFTNALEAMSSGDTLFISSRDQASRIEIVIKNSGSSIPPEHLTKVFEPSFTNRKGGHGIGLSIAKNYVLEHGGKINCQSDKNEVSFMFDLPKGIKSKEDIAPVSWPQNTDEILEQQGGASILARTEQQSINAAIRELEKRQKFKILVLEDEKFYQDYITGLLEDLSWRSLEVVFCENEKSFADNAPDTDLVICDVDLGLSKDGIEILSETRFSKKPFVCIHTQRWDRDDLKRALDAGSDEILAKPMTKAHLYGLIVKSLKR